MQLNDGEAPPADYARFPAVVSDDALAGFFFFDETDRRLIGRRRRDANRLGSALQLGTVRYLGRFLEDAADMPAPVVRYVARKLAMADPGVFGEYARSRARNPLPALFVPLFLTALSGHGGPARN